MNVWGWRLDGLVLLLHERCCGLGEGAVFRAHDEIEGACAAGSGSVIGEGIGVDGEDGSGPASSGPVVGIFAVSDAVCDRFEGLAPDSVEFLLGPSAGHEVLLQAVWGRGESARARGCFRFPVSLHPWGGWRRETVRGFRRPGSPARSGRLVQRGRVRAVRFRRSRRTFGLRCGSGVGRGAFRPRRGWRGCAREGSVCPARGVALAVRRCAGRVPLAGLRSRVGDRAGWLRRGGRRRAGCVSGVGAGPEPCPGEQLGAPRRACPGREPPFLRA